MRKEEFLQLLREALEGDVPAGVIEENIRYYNDYITGEVRKGQTEEEVIEEIGDPRLIARTIEDTTDTADGAGGSYGQSETYEESGRKTENNPYDRSDYDTGRSLHVYNMDKWYWRVLGIVAVIGVIWLLITVVGGIFALVAPFIGPILIIWLVIRIFSGNSRR